MTTCSLQNKHCLSRAKRSVSTSNSCGCSGSGSDTAKLSVSSEAQEWPETLAAYQLHIAMPCYYFDQRQVHTFPSQQHTHLLVETRGATWSVAVTVALTRETSASAGQTPACWSNTHLLRRLRRALLVPFTNAASPSGPALWWWCCCCCRRQAQLGCCSQASQALRHE